MMRPIRLCAIAVMLACSQQVTFAKEQTTTSVASSTTDQTTTKAASSTTDQTTTKAASSTTDQTTTKAASSTTEKTTTSAASSTTDQTTTNAASSTTDQTTTNAASSTTEKTTTNEQSSTTKPISTETTTKRANTASTTSPSMKTTTPGNTSQTAGAIIESQSSLNLFWTVLVEKDNDIYKKLTDPTQNYTVFAASNDVLGNALNNTLKSNESRKQFLQSSIVQGGPRFFSSLKDKDTLVPLTPLYQILIAKTSNGIAASLVDRGVQTFPKENTVSISSNKTRYFHTSHAAVYIIDHLLIPPPDNLTPLAIIGIVVAACAATCLIVACIVNLVRQKRNNANAEDDQDEYQKLDDEQESS